MIADDKLNLDSIFTNSEAIEENTQAVQNLTQAILMQQDQLDNEKIDGSLDGWTLNDGVYTQNAGE